MGSRAVELAEPDADLRTLAPQRRRQLRIFGGGVSHGGGGLGCGLLTRIETDDSSSASLMESRFTSPFSHISRD